MHLNLRDISYSRFQWITGEFDFRDSSHPEHHFYRTFNHYIQEVIHDYDLWRSKEDVEKDLAELKLTDSFIKPLLECYNNDDQTVYDSIDKQGIIGYMEEEYYDGGWIEKFAHYFEDVIISKDSRAYGYFFAYRICNADNDYMHRFLSFHLIENFNNDINDFAFFLMNIHKEHQAFGGIRKTQFSVAVEKKDTMRSKNILRIGLI